MPKGPIGEKHPADAIGLAVMVGKIATGEIEDNVDDDGKDKAAQALGRKGGKARAETVTPERPAASRWKAPKRSKVRAAGSFDGSPVAVCGH